AAGRRDVRRVLAPAQGTTGAGPGAGARQPLSQCDAPAPDLRHPVGPDDLFRGGAGDRAAELCRDRGACQVPDARRGHRMNPFDSLPVWAAVLVGICLVAGAAITFAGTVGLVRFASFYQRVHAPTLGSSFGAGFV